MSFHEKSIWSMLAANILVYGWYFSKMVTIAATVSSSSEPIEVAAFAPYLIPTIVALIVIAIVSHIIIALHSLKSDGEVDDTEDERDMLIKLRGENKSGAILGLGVVITIALILTGHGPFWTANALLASLIVSETVAGVFKIVDYQRSF